MEGLKEVLKNELKSILNKKYASYQEAVNDLQESLESEGRSTAGDKHYTARAMVHNELDKTKKSMMEVRKQLEFLAQISSTKQEDKVSVGSLIQTDKVTYYFIGPGLGMIKVSNATIACVSPTAPISQQLLNKAKGDKISFNQLSFEIVAIW